MANLIWRPRRPPFEAVGPGLVGYRDLFGLLVTDEVPCPDCEQRAGTGVEPDAGRYLFGCLHCGCQWSAPKAHPRAVEPGSRWHLSL